MIFRLLKFVLERESKEYEMMLILNSLSCHKQTNSLPLSLEEIANSMDAKEFQNVSPPQELLDNAAFQFLRS